MSEPSSALFLIADDCEFRFARFYSVYEGVVRAARKSAHCLWCAGHVPVGLSKRGRDTESDADIQPEEMLTFFSNEFPSAFSSEIPRCDLLIILLITQKNSMLIMTIPSVSNRAVPHHTHRSHKIFPKMQETRHPHTNARYLRTRRRGKMPRRDGAPRYTPW